jgi:hypothetical protein
MSTSKFDGDIIVNRITTGSISITSGATNNYILVTDSNGDITQKDPINILSNIGNVDLTLTDNRSLDFSGKTLSFNNVKNFRILDIGSRVSGETTLYLQSSKNIPQYPIIQLNNSDTNVFEVDSDGSLKLYGNSSLNSDNSFGTSLSNQHTFSGSVNIEGSIFLNNEEILTVSDSVVEFTVSGVTDGSNNIFILNTEPSQSYPFLFFVDGVLQVNNTYTISGVTLTTNTPPLSGSPLQGYGVIVTGKDRYKNLSITVDNGMNQITSGVKSIINIPFDGQIIGWSILTNTTGDTVIDIYKDSFDNFTYPGNSLNSITGSNKPTLSSQVKVKSFDLNSWTTNVNKYDVLTINVDSVTNINYLNFNLYLKDVS